MGIHSGALFFNLGSHHKIQVAALNVRPIKRAAFFQAKVRDAIDWKIGTSAMEGRPRKGRCTGGVEFVMTLTWSINCDDFLSTGEGLIIDKWMRYKVCVL
ncbi:hypothetical protein CDAR_127451 [Caerostris darwini]|uniref:Uncharacterized protein n=1 Tax=Caerostris darwini TaxID=1538125 RepID=A0AAV4UVH2_9ARAC|nr:hypothetical protein CDAR_127451 [Caerostris darwini]